MAVASKHPATAELPEPSSLFAALVRTARPKQWVKNLLVVAAPGAAGILFDPGSLWRTAVAFVALCLAASGTYFLNDALDVDADRIHPVKKHRPVASGEVSVSLAKTMAVVLIVAGIAIAAPVNSGRLSAVVAGYAALTVAYTVWLKHEPVLDLGAVAGGFVLRAVAGGVATNVSLSTWFLVVTGAASLFIVAGKRQAELTELGASSAQHRATLAEYTAGYLSFVRAVSASVTITAYCLWAFEEAARVGDVMWFRASIIPFVLVMLRYAYVVETGGGSAPEDVLFGDRVVLILSVLWVLTFAIGVVS